VDFSLLCFPGCLFRPINLKKKKKKDSKETKVVFGNAVQPASQKI